jgi:hypothetical protein
VLANLHRATRPGGLFDLTVEEAAEPVIEEAFTTLARRGLPPCAAKSSTAMSLATTTTRVGDRVAGWLNAARVQVIDEGFSQEDGWGYRHFLLQSARQQCIPGGAPVQPVSLGT